MNKDLDHPQDEIKKDAKKNNTDFGEWSETQEQPSAYDHLG